MTSATEELRRLLDERGVEHYDGTETTLWLKDEHGYRASADELSSGRLSVHIWCDTPEQAIAATLGNGVERTRTEYAALTVEQVRETIERHSAWVIGNNRCFRGGAYEEIADELNATLGSGECTRVKSGTKPDGSPRYRCSNCKYGIGDKRWSYCPKCGRKVEHDRDV